MSVGLTDGPTEDYSAVYVTITEIQVNQQGGDVEGGWVTVAEPNRTFNLLDLTDGVVEGLGEGPLEAGSYNQVRLIIGTVPDDGPNILCHSHPFANYVVDADDQEIHELTVPSGEQTGIKIICAGKCEVAENQTTELILDFDAAASVVVAGNSGIYNLKPTIKLLETQDFTLITGRVLAADGAAIANAEVSAQVFNPAAADPVDRVLIQASTLTDLNGDYQLFVRPGDYNLVATATGFETAAVNFAAVAAANPVQDFTLAVVETGTLGGTLAITGADADTFAFLSLEQELSLGGLPESVEVESLDILNGSSYSAELAAGSYDAVAATCGFPTQEAAVEISAGAETVLNLSF
ncbi:MAG TPA: DUF4382 domain-containing protein [bacterium]|nr:DUF4382 domain-containing protein [bacterium]